MSAPNFSVNPFAVLHSTVESGNAGDVLIEHATLPGYVLATAANRGTRRSAGIALAAYSPRRAVTLQSVGKVDRSIVNLGAGEATYVRVSSAGRLERISDPTNSDDVIGSCDAEGTVTLSPAYRVPIGGTGSGLPTNWKDPTTNGADTTGNTSCVAAFETTLESFGAQYEGGTLYLRQGDYYLDDDLVIDRRVEIRGIGPLGGYAQCTLTFAPGKGVVMEYDAADAIFKHVRVVCSRVPYTIWAPSTAYTVGQYVLAPNDNRYTYRCIQAGTSKAGNAPFNIVDVNGTPTYMVDSNGIPIDGGHTMEEIIDDGTAKWAIEIHAGILVKGACHIEHVSVQGSLNAGIHIQAGGPEWPGSEGLNANNGSIKSCHVIQCGMGFWARGNDSNQWHIQSLDCTGNGFGITGLGGHGIWDHAFLGNTHISCHTAASSGRAYIQDVSAAGGATYLNCYAEGDQLPSRIQSPAVWLGGANGATFTSDSTALILSQYDGCSGYVTRDAVRTDLSARIGNNDGYTAFAVRTNESGANQLVALTYERPTDPPGQWIWQFGPANRRQYFSLTDRDAPEGPGWMHLPNGHLLGALSYSGTGTALYVGIDTSLRDKGLRGGRRLLGDEFRNSAPSSGTWYRRVLTSAGYRGIAWTASTAYGTAYAPGFAADMVEPVGTAAWATAGTKVFRCTVSGTSGTVEPTWASATTAGVSTISDGSVTWLYVGDTPAWVTIETL